MKTRKPKPIKRLTQEQADLIDSNVIDFINRIAPAYTPISLRFSGDHVETTRECLADYVVRCAICFDPAKSNSFIGYVKAFARLNCHRFWMNRKIKMDNWRKESNCQDLPMYISLYRKITSQDGSESQYLFENGRSDKNQVETEETNKMVLNAINKYLDEREKTIVCCFYGIGDSERFDSLYQIAKTYKMSNSTVKSIHKKAIAKLRRAMEKDGILRHSI